MARKKGNSLVAMNTLNLNKASDKNAEDSVDSFEDEIKRVDKDFEDKVLDKELMVDKRGVGNDDSNRLNSKESDDEDEQEKSTTDKDGKKKNDEDSDEEF